MGTCANESRLEGHWNSPSVLLARPADPAVEKNG
jgi:hypothetical protein